MFRILTVDDHALVRAGLRALLEAMDGVVNVFEANTSEEALGQLAVIEPLDLIILDLALPGTDGLSSIPLFRERLPGTPIAIFSATDEADQARQALAAGARGYLLKAMSSDAVLKAVRLVLSGGVFVPPGLLLAEPPADRPPEPAAPPVQLTPRQHEVLRLLVQGKPNKSIARELDMAPSTVRVHITAIFKALDVTNRTEAAFTATRLGLIAEDFASPVTARK